MSRVVRFKLIIVAVVVSIRHCAGRTTVDNDILGQRYYEEVQHRKRPLFLVLASTLSASSISLHIFGNLTLATHHTQRAATARGQSTTRDHKSRTNSAQLQLSHQQCVCLSNYLSCARRIFHQTQLRHDTQDHVGQEQHTPQSHLNDHWQFPPKMNLHTCRLNSSGGELRQFLPSSQDWHNATTRRSRQMR